MIDRAPCGYTRLHDTRSVCTALQEVAPLAKRSQAFVQEDDDGVLRVIGSHPCVLQRRTGYVDRKALTPSVCSHSNRRCSIDDDR